MRAPQSWIKEFVDIPSKISAQDIAAALIRVGFEVEEVIEQGSDLSGPLVIGEVLTIEEVTEFKKPIRFVGLDCGEKAPRYVICGATNFKVGDLVVVALPGAVLPGDFKIAARETYGKTSNGMICSARELGLGEDHSGIMTFEKGVVSVGDDAIKALEINDVIFDVAVNPDRGYALSIRGLAREVSGALGLKFTDPTDRIKTLTFSDTGKGVSAKIADSSSASIFYLRTLSGFNAKSVTPLWMRTRIEKCGMRAISLAVDITNYVMLELGQPLHAFDKAKISGGLKIAKAGSAQKFTTLDGQVRNLAPDDLMVFDDKVPLALAGTMGGLDSEISDSTTDIALEAVRFDPVSIAKNSRRHKLSSEASRRLERSVDPALAEIASARAVELMIAHGGATHVATTIDGKAALPAAITLDPSYINSILGLNLSNQEITEVLQSVGCEVSNKFVVTPPSWRSDLQAPWDLAEEVARMVGYDKIPSILPPRPKHATLTWAQKRKRSVSLYLAGRGFAEVQTFPFTHPETIKSMGYVGERAATYQIANPMSEDAPVLRTHLLPGLIEVAARNISRGAKDFAIFEMGSIFRNSQALVDAVSPKLDKKPSGKELEALFASVPPQPIHVGALLVGKTEVEDWQGKARPYTWSDAIAYTEQILDLCNLQWTLKRSDFAPWHPGRCAELLVDGKPVAHAGELHPRVIAKYGLPERSAAFVVSISALPESPRVRPTGVGIMPAALQDVALIVDQSVPAADVEAALRKGAGPLLESISLFDRYDKIGDGKISLAFTLVFRAADRTLTGAEVTEARESAVVSAEKATGAVLRTA
jgi:phenylalanyl-tRNA synthetase beta chain